MKTMFLMLIIPFLLFAQGYEFMEKSTRLPFPSGSDTLVNADTLISEPCIVAKWKGAVTLAVQMDSLSGTPGDITVEVCYRLGDLNYSEWKLVGQITAAQHAAEEGVYWNLSNKTWWTYISDLKVRVSASSGTFTSLVKCYIRGQ